MSEQTATLLRDLAAKLGTTVDHLYGVVLRQVPCVVCARHDMGGVDAGNCPLDWCGLDSFCGMTADEFDDPDPLIPKRACALLIIAAAVPCLGFGVINNAYAALTCVMNPEFSALTYILQSVKQ